MSVLSALLGYSLFKIRKQFTKLEAEIYNSEQKTSQSLNYRIDYLSVEIKNLKTKLESKKEQVYEPERAITVNEEY